MKFVLKPSKKTITIIVLLVLITAFFTWRFLRPMQIFVVADRFAYPIDTQVVPKMLKTLKATGCKNCHSEFYAEWNTTIHSQAWTDPYFQTDWKFEGKAQICKNCHTPLDAQQKQRLVAYKDKDRLNPILEPNPKFDEELQHEGVTCLVCHLKDGKISGPFADGKAPHAVTKMHEPNKVCVRCHVVDGDRWDNFFTIPPCGTVAEIYVGKCQGDANCEAIAKKKKIATNYADLGCVQCHMPLVERPLVTGGPTRQTRKHLWRGGHDPDMVKSALKAELITNKTANSVDYHVTLENVGAGHYLPTGTPDRHLTVEVALMDANKKVIETDEYKLIRSFIWRPFIIELSDGRIPQGSTRKFSKTINLSNKKAKYLKATIRYHLLEEKRRKHIGYKNKDPISYAIFEDTHTL